MIGVLKLAALLKVCVRLTRLLLISTNSSFSTLLYPVIWFSKTALLSIFAIDSILSCMSKYNYRQKIISSQKVINHYLQEKQAFILIMVVYYSQQLVIKVSMASLKAFLLIIVFATITVAIDEFKNQRQLAQCIQDCHEPITACLKQHESACAKAYIHCHTQKDFLVCIQSANSLMMQSIGKCMKETCKPIQETQKQLKNHENQEMGEEFRWFNRPKEVKDTADKDDDIQLVPETAVKPSGSPSDSKGKNGN